MPDVATSADFLRPPRPAHLVGICGAGMKSLAALLHSQGWTLSGSDASITAKLKSYFDCLGIAVHTGHNAHQLPADCELLIYSAAIPESNPERQAAARRDIPQLSYVEALAQLMVGRLGVSIAGTHGKSSTTAMIGNILEVAGRNAVVVYGAELQSASPVSGEHSPRRSNDQPSLCVVESCEYRSHFLKLQPHIICLTGVEADHFDCYPNLAAAREAYAKFLAKIPDEGHCIVNADDPIAIELTQQFSGNLTRFSVQGAKADWTVSEVAPDGSEFNLHHADQMLGGVHWNQRGHHQVANALAAAATCGTLGIPPTDILAGLNRFPGLRRRLENRGQCGGVQFFDDYAHHPTSVAAVLKTIRSGMNSGRLWCAFQPHQVSRTRNLMQEFAESLSLADEVFVVPVFGARESESSEFVSTSEELTLLVRQAGVHSHFLPQLDALQATLETAPMRGDTVVTLGAGDIDRIYYEFTRPVQRDYEV